MSLLMERERAKLKQNRVKWDLHELRVLPRASETVGEQRTEWAGRERTRGGL